MKPRRPTLARAAAAAVLAVAGLSAPVGASAAEAFLGVYAHDVDDELAIGHSPEGGAQVVAGLRSAPIQALHAIGRPMAHVLGGVNTKGGIAYAAAGLSWRFNLARRLYLQPGIGAAIHTGKVDLPSPSQPGITAAERAARFAAFRTHLDLGSRVLFEPELALGWRATDRLAVELSWLHVSHAQLAGKQNPGLSDVGVRAVWGW